MQTAFWTIQEIIKEKYPEYIVGIYIWMDNLPEEDAFFMNKEQSFVLPNSVFIYNNSYISPLSQNLVMVQYELNPEVNLINCKMQIGGQNQEMRQG